MRSASRPVMIVSQLVVATGPLFLFMATRERWWWLVGAYVAWIAYAGLNVGLDNIKLKLAPADNNAPYLAAYYTVSDVIYGSSILLAGWTFDRLEDRGFDTAQHLRRHVSVGLARADAGRRAAWCRSTSRGVARARRAGTRHAHDLSGRAAAERDAR